MKLYNIYTIKWLRRQVNEKVMERSVNSLLYENKKLHNKVINKKQNLNSSAEKNTSITIEHLEKNSNKNIKLKYFFTDSVLNKLKKLRDIFLEFDKKQTGKIQII